MHESVIILQSSACQLSPVECSEVTSALLFTKHVPVCAACSSSLMAFNDAITDLDTGRIDYAVVGGASGIFRPQTSIAFQRLHMMSPDVSMSPSPSSLCALAAD